MSEYIYLIVPSVCFAFYEGNWTFSFVGYQLIWRKNDLAERINLRFLASQPSQLIGVLRKGLWIRLKISS
jgi:hypothetical protein